MNHDEIRQALQTKLERAVNITFVDGESQSVVVINLDDEGFVHKVGDEFFWSTFDDVSEVSPAGLAPGPRTAHS